MSSRAALKPKKNLTRELVLTFTSRSRLHSLMKIAEVLDRGDLCLLLTDL